MEENKIVAYKGTNMNMKCRGFQYELGKEYETDEAECCESGFHACENALDVLRYYPPDGKNRYFAVSQSGKTSRADDDTKIASTHIAVNVEIGIAGIIKAAIDFVFNKCKNTTEQFSSGEKGNAAASGWRGNAAASGWSGNAAASGNCSAAAATGEFGSCSAKNNSVALAAGYMCKAKADKGSVICIVERGDWDGNTNPIKGVKAAIVDGITLKEDTYYRLKDGEFVEAEDDGEED